ncbi:hypothetical protein J1N35_017916 [Gossypium stocksii]|uniref:Uncharacterized protein n=1 Tax=Gossypium stocksii TaxID=47602 RepID=A0A9D3VNA1_9ROSI|nr:hypothetical protein J1N35_017916 [Gossypium stocksii]
MRKYESRWRFLEYASYLRVDVVTRQSQRPDKKIGHISTMRRMTSRQGACDVVTWRHVPQFNRVFFS